MYLPISNVHGKICSTYGNVHVEANILAYFVDYSVCVCESIIKTEYLSKPH